MTVNALSWNIITKMVGLTTVIIKLPRNGHPSAVRCSLFRIWSGIGLKHAMHVVVIICERLLKNFSNLSRTYGPTDNGPTSFLCRDDVACG